MKQPAKTLLLALAVTAILPLVPARAASTPHHLYNISRKLVETTGAPLYGIFVKGPKNIKQAYNAEVWGQEKPAKRGKFIHKAAGVLRSPGEEIKGIVDGLTDCVSSLGQAAKEFVSIFFGD